MQELGERLFFSKFIVNLIIAIQVGLSLGAINYSALTYNNLMKSYNYTYTFNDAYYFLDKGTFEDVDYETLESYNTYFEKITSPKKCEDFTLFAYKTNTLERLKTLLKKGDWLDKNKQENVINCVITNGNKSLIGTYLTTTINSKEYKFYVCGSFGNNAVYVNNQVRGTSTYNIMFSEFSKDDGLGVYCLYDEVKDVVKSSLNALVFVDKNYEKEVQNIVAPLGQFHNMEKVRSVAKKNVDENFKTVVPIGICFLILSVISLVCMTSINFTENKPLFKLFHYYGLRKVHIFTMALTYCGNLMVFAYFVAVILMFIFYKIGWSFYGFFFKNNIIFINLAIFLLCVFIVSLVSLLTYKYKPISED